MNSLNVVQCSKRIFLMLCNAANKSVDVVQCSKQICRCCAMLTWLLNEEANKFFPCCAMLTWLFNNEANKFFNVVQCLCDGLTPVRSKLRKKRGRKTKLDTHQSSRGRLGRSSIVKTVWNSKMLWDRRTDGRTDWWMDGRMDGWTDGWMDRWMDRPTDRLIDQPTDWPTNQPTNQPTQLCVHN